MDKMIEDIDFAIANLPSTKSAYEITKWSAMALKSRFLLFEGTFRKYHTEFNYGANAHDAKWYLDECAKVSEEFMASSGYGIHTAGGAKKAYYSLFTTPNATENMDEVILARNYNATYNVTHSANNTMISATMGRHGMTRKLVASYLMADGSRFTDQAGWETMDFLTEVQNRDPRLSQSIRTPGYTRVGDSTPCPPNFLHCMTGYHPTKYVMGLDKDVYSGSDIDLIIFRAAEILLNFAEAKAEAGTLTQADLDASVNKLRDRVGLPHLNMEAANANPDPFLTSSLRSAASAPWSWPRKASATTTSCAGKRARSSRSSTTACTSRVRASTTSMPTEFPMCSCTPAIPPLPARLLPSTRWVPRTSS